MKKLGYKSIIVTMILLSSQHAFSAAISPAVKPQPNKWKVLFLSTGLTAVNYFALTRVLVPLTVKVSRGSVTSGLAFTGLVAAERFMSPILMKYAPTGFFTKKEWKDSQRNAMIAASLLYVTPNAVKDRFKSVYPAFRKAFFKKTHNGMTVKSFEQFQEITPKIAIINGDLKDTFQKIITFEDTIKSLKERLNTSGLTLKVQSGIEQDLNKTYEFYKNAIVDFSNLLIQKESQREILYENYNVPELEDLKTSAAMLLSQSKLLDLKDFLKNFNSLKELYTKIQGGILGFVGEGLKYFEGE